MYHLHTKKFTVFIWPVGYKMNLGTFTWISTWQAFDKMLTTSQSLFTVHTSLAHISNCLVDITLIADTWNLSKAVLVILHSQTCCCLCTFDFAEDITISSDVHTRHLGIICKLSFPTHILLITTFFRVYHTVSWGLFKRISQHIPTRACIAKPPALIASHDTFSYPFAPVNWSL